MNPTAPHIKPRGLCRTALFVVFSVLIATAATGVPNSRAGEVRRAVGAAPRVITIHYTAHGGAEREATVLLPAWYRPGTNPPLPLVISPHGRGGNGRSNARFWGNLPTVGRFAVVNPDGMGRRLRSFSYGFRGQIDDLARMPQVLVAALPWVRIDRSRIYALGSSMGGQETLLLVARHPRLLAGAAAMDSVTDLALRYDQTLELPDGGPAYVKRWGPQSVCLQSAMRREVGGTPATNPTAYSARSPLSLASKIAASGVPLQIWWSRVDKIVMHQETQSGALYLKLVRLGTRAPLDIYIGRWAHSKEMRSTALLPVALMRFGLLPRGFARVPASVRHAV